MLRKRQSEQLDAQQAEDNSRRAELNDGSVNGGGATLEADEIAQLRKELNARVSIVAGKTGRPHGAIHTEARNACGGPPTALCNAEQLRDRIAYLRDW